MGWDVMRSNEKKTKSSNVFGVFLLHNGVETMHGFFLGGKNASLRKNQHFTKKHSCKNFSGWFTWKMFFAGKDKEKHRPKPEICWVPNLNCFRDLDLPVWVPNAWLWKQGVVQFIIFLGFFFGHPERKVLGCTSKFTHQIWSLIPWRVPCIGDS